ncbi:NAD-dependent epimerase/dehydratase family protein [Brevibacillus brevis]|uniref:NAD-dependent epimerase/dehydratase family protein n=1 Tax=Brevibacillus brevis TaxID=1393 RepID=UPI00339272CD
MMRVLITGGAGFIGSHIVDVLVKNGHEVIVLDNLVSGKLSHVPSNVKVYKADITSEEINSIFATCMPEVVIHHAAQIDVQLSLKDPMFDADVNIRGTINLLQACAKYHVRKIVYASSAAVYGTPLELPISESHPTTPISFYGISKLVPESYIKVYSSLYGLDFTILRYSNVYGERQDPKGEGGVISIFADKIISNQTPTIFGDGKNTRDFIYVGDVADANLAALSLGSQQTFNISTNTSTTLLELYDTMRKVAGSDIVPAHVSERYGDIKHSSLDNGFALNGLEWTPRVTLAEGLERTIHYYQNFIETEKREIYV